MQIRGRKNSREDRIPSDKYERERRDYLKYYAQSLRLSFLSYSIFVPSETVPAGLVRAKISKFNECDAVVAVSVIRNVHSGEKGRRRVKENLRTTSLLIEVTDGPTTDVSEQSRRFLRIASAFQKQILPVLPKCP